MDPTSICSSLAKPIWPLIEGYCSIIFPLSGQWGSAIITPPALFCFLQCLVLLSPHSAGLLPLNGECDNRPGGMTGYNWEKETILPQAYLFIFYWEASEVCSSFFSPMFYSLFPIAYPLHLFPFTPVSFDILFLWYLAACNFSFTFSNASNQNLKLKRKYSSCHLKSVHTKILSSSYCRRAMEE